jgi:inner membrane protein
MYFAHLPSGYIAVSLLSGRLCRPPVPRRSFMFWGVLGSIAPDFDFMACILFYHRMCDHHRFPTHYPLLWLGLLTVSFLWLLLDRYRTSQPALAVMFFFGGFLHTILDMFTGHLFLFAPFSFVRQTVSFSEYGFWDPLFLECFIILWAFILWKKQWLLQLLSQMDAWRLFGE